MQANGPAIDLTTQNEGIHEGHADDRLPSQKSRSKDCLRTKLEEYVGTVDAVTAQRGNLRSFNMYVLLLLFEGRSGTFSSLFHALP